MEGICTTSAALVSMFRLWESLPNRWYFFFSRISRDTCIARWTSSETSERCASTWSSLVGMLLNTFLWFFAWSRERAVRISLCSFFLFSPKTGCKISADVTTRAAFSRSRSNAAWEVVVSRVSKKVMRNSSTWMPRERAYKSWLDAAATRPWLRRS